MYVLLWPSLKYSKALPHLVLVIDFDDHDGRVGFDVLSSTVDQNLLKDQQLVPRWRQRLVNDLQT